MFLLSNMTLQALEMYCIYSMGFFNRLQNNTTLYSIEFNWDSKFLQKQNPNIQSFSFQLCKLQSYHDLDWLINTTRCKKNFYSYSKTNKNQTIFSYRYTNKTLIETNLNSRLSILISYFSYWTKNISVQESSYIISITIKRYLALDHTRRPKWPKYASSWIRTKKFQVYILFSWQF